MNKLWLPGILFVLVLISCNKKDEEFTDEERSSDPGIFFITSSGLSFRFDDFDIYDSSAHMFYLKENHEEIKGIEMDSFVFMENLMPVYSGIFWPAHLSSIPSGPFISTIFSFYPPYVMRVDYIHSPEPDPRNSPEMIRVLRHHGLLHSGLSVTIDDAGVNGRYARIDVTVTNRDVTDLLVLDPAKMGTDLFHYFTTGIYVYTANNDFLAYSVINPSSPGQEWSPDWLTRLGHGESLHFTLSYALNAEITNDEYIVKFRYPGLGNDVPIDQLYQGDARIWLGDILCSKRVSRQ